MKKVALFPGTFDPITIGHTDIVFRSLDLFDEIIIGIGDNSEKKYLFPVEKRIQWIEELFSKENKIRVHSYKGLTVDFCKKMEAKYILRGLRTVTDFDYERGIAQMNKSLAPHIDTVFLISRPEYSAISSTIVRDIIRNGGDASAFLPEGLRVK